MKPDALDPFGLALWDHFQGNTSAVLTIKRDDGLEIALPAGHFFRPPEEFSAIENLALGQCRGRVLDVGAGSGLHSLVLQAGGFRSRPSISAVTPSISCPNEGSPQFTAPTSSTSPADRSTRC